MPSLWRLYAGAGLSPSTRKGIGTNAAASTSGRYLNSRRKLVEHQLATGQIKQSTMSVADLASVGLGGNTKLHGGGLLSGITGFFKNLGGDVYDFGKGLGPGLYTLGKSVVHDANVPGVIAEGGHSDLYSKILKPTIQQYKQTYGEGNVLQNLYQHPLQPILDVATVTSLGAGAAAKAGTAARAGSLGEGAQSGRLASLAKITDISGRPDAVLKGGKAVSREYTPRPLSKAGQIGLDKLGAKFDRVGEFQGTRAMKREDRQLEQHTRATVNRVAAEIAKPLAESAKRLSIPEAIAFAFSKRGINTPERVNAVRQLWGSTDEATRAEQANRGIDSKYTDMLQRNDIAIHTPDGEVPDGILYLVQHPSPAMQDFSNVWDADVAHGRHELGIEDAQHNEAISLYQRALDSGNFNEPTPYTEDFKLDQPEGTLPINYLPDKAAENFDQSFKRQRLNKLTLGAVPKGEAIFRRIQQPRNERLITNQTLLAPNARPYTYHTSGETVGQGIMRVDPKLYVEHAVRRERDLIENAFKQELVDKMAAKLPNIKHPAIRSAWEAQMKKQPDEPLRFANTQEMREVLGDGWELVNPEFAIAWFRAEANFTEEASHAIRGIMDATDPDEAASMQAVLDRMPDADSEAFVKSHWSAMKRKGVAVPKEFADYQKALIGVTEPFKLPGARAYMRLMHRWRNTVLAYMPRWAINTAIGSFVTNMVKGVWNPQHYVEGNRLGRAFQNPDTNEVFLQPSWLQRRMGAEDLNTSKLEQLEPPGTSLKNESIAEMIEPSMGGGSDLTLNMPTEKFVMAVQSIEDFFRRASLVHSLKREQRQGRGLADDSLEIPEPVAQSMEDVLTDHYKNIISRNGKVDELVRDPELVKRSIRDVNKFGYNYAALGPFERRYVRQLVPFWGWYKFITELAYRLPVEYPGRTAAMQALSQIGTDQINELGMVPPWVRGAIILNHNKATGALSYLTTAGMNPFATFANPLGREGPIQGAVGLGQLNPAVQAGLQGFGFDTLTGGQVRVSPESGVTQNQFGQLVSTKTGENVSPAQVKGLQRGIMALLRTVPQVRLGEKYVLNHGGSVYPESVPFLDPKPLSPASPDATNIPDPIGVGSGDIGLSMLGLMPHSQNLTKYQQQAIKSKRYAETRARNAILRRKQKEAAK